VLSPLVAEDFSVKASARVYFWPKKPVLGLVEGPNWVNP